MDLGSLMSTAASAGPPARRGDAVTGGPKAVVEGMKAGLRAKYVKEGKLSPEAVKTSALYESTQKRSSGPSKMLEGLKTGLRAFYTKNGTPIQETTVAPSVGVGTERALGGPVHWGGGLPSERRDKPVEKSGTSLRGVIQNLERSLEQTLVSLSNRKSFNEAAEVELRGMLFDALAEAIRSGNFQGLKELKMQATLIESSKFIGDQVPETAQVLTSANDPGAEFSRRMGADVGAITEMVATQLSSGMPLHSVRSNVAAAMQSTVNQRVRGTLMKAARILADF